MNYWGHEQSTCKNKYFQENPTWQCDPGRTLEGLSEETSSELRPEQEEASQGEGKGVPGRENSLHKGSGVGMSWMHAIGLRTKLPSFWCLASICSSLLEGVEKNVFSCTTQSENATLGCHGNAFLHHQRPGLWREKVRGGTATTPQSGTWYLHSLLCILGQVASLL